MPTLKVLSLCTGIGALDMAVQASLKKQNIDTEFVAFAENDPNCTKVLAYHYPDVPNLGDIKKVDWTEIQADVISAGFPCQPFSFAGMMKGDKDERYLWPFIDQAIRTIGPRYIFLENVAGFRSQGFGDVASSLASNGYDLRWHSVRASDIGAPHRRDRIFIVGRHTANAYSV